MLIHAAKPSWTMGAWSVTLCVSIVLESGHARTPQAWRALAALGGVADGAAARRNCFRGGAVHSRRCCAMCRPSTSRRIYRAWNRMQGHGSAAATSSVSGVRRTTGCVADVTRTAAKARQSSLLRGSLRSTTSTCCNSWMISPQATESMRRGRGLRVAPGRIGKRKTPEASRPQGFSV